MNLTRPAIAVAGLAVAGAAFVGSGAGATFTTSTVSGQTVKAGTLHVSVAGSNTTCTLNDASGCHALTLPDVGPVGSTFDTKATVIKMTNTGDIPAYFSSIQMSETHANNTASDALRNQMNVCIHSKDPSGTWVEGNGPLTTATALTPTVQENPVELKPGQSATYWVEFYAGEDSSCGTTVSDGSHTASAWEGYDGGGYTTPASLTNAAEGGSVTPALTFAFTG